LEKAFHRSLRMSRLTQRGVGGSDNMEAEEKPYTDASMASNTGSMTIEWDDSSPRLAAEGMLRIVLPSSKHPR
jgi:hypothetical protein